MALRRAVHLSSTGESSPFPHLSGVSKSGSGV